MCRFIRNILNNENFSILYIAETWLSGKIHKNEEFKSVINNHQICRADRRKSLAFYVQDVFLKKKTNKQTNKQGRCITITDVVRTKANHQFSNGACGLQILNCTRKLCYQSLRLKSLNYTQKLHAKMN